MRQPDWFDKLKIKKFFAIVSADCLTVSVDTVWGAVVVVKPCIKSAIREALHMLIQDAKDHLLSLDTSPDLRHAYTTRVAEILAAWHDAGEEGEP